MEPLAVTATASATRPNILFIMTDQQRFDTIATLGNSYIYTPNLDRLVGRGITFSNGYATCPVCVAARYTENTGCEPFTTRVFNNAGPLTADGGCRKNGKALRSIPRTQDVAPRVIGLLAWES